MATPEEMFRDHLELIEEVIHNICRRAHLRAEEAEDFRAAALLKLMGDDYAVLRKFQGNSTLKTYLTTVLSHYFKDYRNQQWGRWRPCAEAQRQGALAVLLDELTSRDGRGFDEACQILWTNHHVTATREELWRIWELLPPRSSRQMKGEEELQTLPAPEPDPGRSLLEKEGAERRREACRSLYRALDDLPDEDRVIFKLHVRGFQIATISRQLGLEQKPLYRRIETIKKRLREAMKKDGFSWDDIKGFLE